MSLHEEYRPDRAYVHRAVAIGLYLLGALSTAATAGFLSLSVAAMRTFETPAEPGRPLWTSLAAFAILCGIAATLTFAAFITYVRRLLATLDDRDAADRAPRHASPE